MKPEDTARLQQLRWLLRLDDEARQLFKAAEADMAAGRWEAATEKLERLAAREAAQRADPPADRR
jgi:outer membrane protein assembly factor BamD (BamD/ComL family)